MAWVLRFERVKRVLVIDIGGSNVKLLVTGRHKPVKIASGRHLTPKRMLQEVKKASKGWRYNVVTIGYPGLVSGGKPKEDAPNLGRGWWRFDFRRALRKPVKIINDAVMQALGSYEGGRMLFLGLGTGLGSTLILEGLMHPLELGDLPYRNNRTYAEYLGKAGRKRLGPRRWARHARAAVRQLKAALQVDYVVLGGGGAKHIGKPPSGVRLGSNKKAFAGGFKLWQSNSGKYIVD